MYVSRITIENLRTIASQSIALKTPHLPGGDPLASSPDGARGNLTVLLGNNGSGKTTVLRAIAMAAMAPVLLSGSGFVPYSLVRRVNGAPARTASVRGLFSLYPRQDNPPDVRPIGADVGEIGFELLLGPGSSFNDRILNHLSPPLTDYIGRSFAESLFDDRSGAALVVGYGADRRVDSQSRTDIESRYKHRVLRYDRIAGLFEESVALIPIGAWLPRFRMENPGRHRQVIALINKVLPDAEIEAEPHDGEYLFSLRGSSLPLAALSDGYRSFIGWFADLLFHICRGAPPEHQLDQTTGIVLIDEVDLHLHPAWQREVVPRVADALPHMQFIVSTHSPLVVGSLHRENVLVLTDVDEGEGVRKTVVERPDAETFGLGAEQLLTSDTFGLESTRAPAFVEKLQEASQQARDGDADAAMHLMRLLSLGDAAGEAPPAPKPIRKAATKKTATKKTATKKTAGRAVQGGR